MKVRELLRLSHKDNLVKVFDGKNNIKGKAAIIYNDDEWNDRYVRIYDIINNVLVIEVY
jgi:predicted HAD superfamily Cof-like phosphohydrolase